MKKYILISFFIVLLLVIFLKNNNTLSISNKTIIIDNVEINYPFFNNKTIDNYIYSYLNKNISLKYNNVFLDYDYYKNANFIDLTLYTYSNMDNIININTKNINVDLVNEKILPCNKKDNNSIYNIIGNNKIDVNKPIIAFTFDDGPNYNTSKMIDVFVKYNVKTTFFVLGSRIKGNENIIKKMATYNMEIGNHTYSHKLLTRLSKDKIIDEINKTNAIIYNIIGSTPTLVRPSYGTVTKKIRNSIVYPIIIWDIDTLDWKYHNSKKIANNILKKVKDGDIILMHDIYSASVNAIDIVIPKLLEKGYQIVTVSELFYYKNITLEKGKVYGSAKNS